MIAEWATVAAIILSLNFQACGFVLVGTKNNNNSINDTYTAQIRKYTNAYQHQT